MIYKDETLWDFCYDVYKNGACLKKEVKKYTNYYEGKLNKAAPAYEQFNKEYKTSDNVIKPIVETKIKAMLDAQFSIGVVPKIKQFNNYAEIKQQEVVADIFDAELNNIFKLNNMDTKKEIIARNGYIAGFSPAQVKWCTDEDERGNIEITPIDPKKLRWDKNASSPDYSTFFAYSTHETPAKVKEKYCKNEDGTYNAEMCRLVDKMTTSKDKAKDSIEDKSRVISYQSNNTGGQAYVGNINGIQTNKYVKMIVMFLLDDSLYSPDEQDDTDITQAKEGYLKKYPNGRMIIFSGNDEEKIIFRDEALPNSFKSLGNISIFNPTQWEGIQGYSEVEDLIPIQERINGTILKGRISLANDITAIVVNKDCGIAQGDFVKFGVIFAEKTDNVNVISNNGIEKAQTVRELIANYKQSAYEMARVNETMMYGARQTGTTSADQVEALQESPQTEIRSQQRNFKDFMIELSKKCLNLIMENYNFGRIISITGNNKYSMAQIQVTVDSEAGKEQKIINLFDKQGQQVEQIVFNEDWQFDIDVIAGTEVPRTRRENALLYDKMLLNGVFDKIQDPDLLEMYLRCQDIPNYRAIVQLMKQKQDEKAKQEESSEANNFKSIIKNPVIAKSFLDFFKAIEGYPAAKQQILGLIGLQNTPGRLDNTPISDTTRQGDIIQAATLAPQIVSDNPNVAVIAAIDAKTQQLEAHNKTKEVDDETE
jgi:hypothetical protein